jgi:hypothetical protein
MKLNLAAVMLVAAASGASAQDYRVRIDARAQSVWFRELEQDSIPLGEAVPTGNGSFETVDGRAVRCTGASHCFFFRAGRRLHGLPVATTANLTMWGLGVEGLSLRGSGRYMTDAGGDDVWGTAQPSLQLIEGLVEYQRATLVARAGRQLLSSRLEAMGFDGGWARYRIDRMHLELTGYGGWGLGQAAVVGASNPALNPLDEWRPRNRQVVAGAEAAWLYRDFDLRGEYRREIDPEDDYFVSERAAVSLGSRLGSFRLHGGLDYNIAEGHLGNVDASATYLATGYSVTAGARRYRPYFSLWTLWGAFSPVPHDAFHVSAETRLTRAVSLHGRAERYQFHDADVSTALVPGLEDRGWRARIGARARQGERWSVDGTLGLERGPGAAAASADLSVGFVPAERFAFDVYAGTLSRPLELRYYDAESRWIGGRAQVQLAGDRRVWADAAFVHDTRDRPDTGGASMNQLRLRAGASIAFGSRADRMPLPPARPSAR